MAVSRNRPKYKVKKKKKNFLKQKQREMQNADQKKVVSWSFHKDRETVEVPINAWQMIAQSARELESIARFVAVVEQVSQHHQTDGTLLPVYQDDLEQIPGKFDERGRPQFKLKDSFWDKSKAEVEKPTIVMADGKTIYDSTAAPKEQDPKEFVAEVLSETELPQSGV